MRHRVKNLLQTDIRTVTWDYYQGGNFHHSTAYSCVFQNGTYGVITDHPIKQKWLKGKNITPKRTTLVDHITLDVETHGASGEYVFPGWTFRTSGYGPSSAIQPEVFPWLPTESSLALARREAFEYFAAGCTKEVLTLGNFIKELPEVLSLKDQAISLIDGISAIKRRKFNSLTTVKNQAKILKKDAKVGANAFLAYEFGVLPLISDLKSIMNSVRMLLDHIKWLKEHSNQETRVEFLKKLDIARPADTPRTDSYNYFTTYTNLTCMFKAFAVIKYDVSQLSSYEIAARTLVQSFGLNNFLTTLWNGAPYSFVLDWFFHIGEFLSQFKVPVTLPYQIIDIGHSTKTICEYSVDFNSWVSQGNPFQKIQTVRHTAYSRVPGLPTPLAGLDLNIPGAKQFVLGLCLGIQKI